MSSFRDNINKIKHPRVAADHVLRRYNLRTISPSIEETSYVARFRNRNHIEIRIFRKQLSSLKFIVTTNKSSLGNHDVAHGESLGEATESLLKVCHAAHIARFLRQQ